MTSADLIRVERRDDTVVVHFARPPVNAFNLELVRQLRRAAEWLATEVPTAGVVVTGDGTAFSAGVDFKEVPQYSREEAAEMVRHINAVITLLYGLPTATVAAVNGHAIGGAFVVMLACDARLVADDADAKLGLTEVTAGIPYPACPMEVVKAEIEPGRRRSLVLSGELVDPAAAFAFGVVDAVVPSEDLLERAIDTARTRAAAASYAVVKEQLKRETLGRLREIVAQDADPLLEGWV